MKKLAFSILIVVSFFSSDLFSGDWTWIPVPEKFNPSGIEIDTLNYEFQFIDWNGDSLLDLIINQQGQLEYYERQSSEEYKWKKKDLPLPSLEKFFFYPDTEFKEIVYSYFPTFAIGDIDNDGDWDIVTDSLHFFQNTGTNSQPKWEKNVHYFENAVDSVSAVCDQFSPWFEGTDTVRLVCRFHPRFLDFNNDGKIYLLLDEYPNVIGGAFYKHLTPRTHLFLNASSAETLHWQPEDSLLDALMLRNKKGVLPYDNFFDVNLSLCDIDNDEDWDIISHSFPAYLTGIDDPPFWHYDFSIWENNGRNFTLHTIETYEAFYPRLLMHYQCLDFDRDNNVDLIITTPRRRLKFIKNNRYSGPFQFDKSIVGFGRLNVETHAVPFFYQKNGTSNQLIVSEDYEEDPFSIWLGPVVQGRLRDFSEWSHLNSNLDSVYYWTDLERHKYEFTGEYYINFYDYDRDDDYDFALSYRWNSYFSVKFYNNEGTNEIPVWLPDSVFLDVFDKSNFHKPYLLDIDNDSEPELFIKKGDTFTCYKNYGTISSPDWREETKFLSGIENLAHYHIAFADLDRDGDQDLIFGEYSGGLSYYENLGANATPQWQYVPDVFQNINVGSNAAPAFADVDFDGDYDLVVGNEKGFLYFYRNESTVSVKAKKSSVEIPARFALLQNFPNPFNLSTIIRFRLKAKDWVSLKIYNLMGEEVAVLADGKMFSPGNHSIRFDAGKLVSGIYLCRFSCSQGTAIQRIVLLR